MIRPRMTIRSPGPSLRPFVKTLWASERRYVPAAKVAERERVLPTGRMHLAFSLDDSPFRLFDCPLDETREAGSQSLGPAVVGGARSAPYLKDGSRPSRSVGAEFHPGACERLFGVRADELAERHTPLDVLWGRLAQTARERLLDEPSPERQLDTLEAILAARLYGFRALHPAVAHALHRFTASANVGETVRQTGYSHRRFVALFQQAVGLTPKRYCRVTRFGRSLARLRADPDISWAELAQYEDYSDQAHFSREFREFAGVTPGDYRRVAPFRPHHLRIGD